MDVNKKLIKYIIAGIIFLLPQVSYSQIKTYRFEQLDSLQRIEKRNIFVFIHTDWCKYCQVMKNTTFKNESIIQKLNNHFYFIALNAEEKRDIFFGGRNFKYEPSGINTGLHKLAEQLATIDKKIAYPTICFLNSYHEILFQYNQFIGAEDLQSIISKLK